MSNDEDDYYNNNQKPLVERLNYLEEDEKSDSNNKEKANNYQKSQQKNKYSKNLNEEEEEEEEEEDDYAEENNNKKSYNKDNYDNNKKDVQLSTKTKGQHFDNYDKNINILNKEYKFNSMNKDRIWEIMNKNLEKDQLSIQESIVKHIEYTLAVNRFDINKENLYQGTALSVRDRLIEQWNNTQLNIKTNNPKKIFYMSIEFLLGRLLQNSLVCLNLEKNYKDALFDLGIRIEEIYDKEKDPALGNGGLGRLAACYIDSMATLNYPGYGYGIRYDYGIFKQVIENFEQKELPDYWLSHINPWEIMRIDHKYKVRFYGYCKDTIRKGKKIRKWEGGEEIIAVAYDIIIPGYNTYNCNTLRLWKSYPSEEFDFDQFNKGEHRDALNDLNEASFITSVLYPNDNTLEGKELRLKQEYFFCSATVQNIIKMFKEYNLPWKDFPKYNCVQLNDTHPTLASVELLRILIDEYHLEYTEAFNIVKNSFNYTNHTVLPEALEKWDVNIFKKLLPRHLELIYLINYHFMESCKKKCYNDGNKMSRLSVIEESYPKQIKMANLCIISSSKINGVAKIHSNLIKTQLFTDFAELWPNKFTNVTNGVTIRRWIHCAFPELSSLLTEYNDGSNKWLSDLSILSKLPEKLKKNHLEKEFYKNFKKAKKQAKLRLKKFVKKNCGIDIDEKFMFDIMVKRIHEYKRQFMNCLYCIHRYLTIKKMPKLERKKLVKRVTFFGGKSAPGYILAKNIIKLINMVASVVNSDKEVSPYYKIIFLPDYKVSSAEIIIPAADISQHISTAGTEASGTSCMKFVMTGSIILGTRDGANIEIAQEIGEDHIVFFGKTVNDVNMIREELKNGKRNYVDNYLQKCFDAIYKNQFGDTSFIHDYITGLQNGGDYYLICHDFYDYVKAQEQIDIEYQNKEEWVEKCVDNICHMGFFSSDRSIKNYADNIWKIQLHIILFLVKWFDHLQNNIQ